MKKGDNGWANAGHVKAPGWRKFSSFQILNMKSDDMSVGFEGEVKPEK
jgi:hypothetical protein